MSQMFEVCVLCGENQEVVRTPLDNRVGYHISYNCPNCGKYISDADTNSELNKLTEEDKKRVVNWIKSKNEIDDSMLNKPDLRDGYEFLD